MGEFRPVAVHVRRDLLHRAARAEHPHGLQRPDLARPRGVHGHRRVRRRDADPRAARARGVSRAARWLPLGDGMRPVFTIPLAGLVTGMIGFLGRPSWPGRGLARARHVRAGRVAAAGREEVRRGHRRRRRARAEPADRAVRLGHLRAALALLRGLGRGGDPFFVAWMLARSNRSRVALDPRRRDRRDGVRRQSRALQDARVRRLACSTQASPARCSRSRSRTSTPTRSCSRSRSCCSRASSSAGSARCRA